MSNTAYMKRSNFREVQKRWTDDSGTHELLFCGHELTWKQHVPPRSEYRKCTPCLREARAARVAQ